TLSTLTQANGTFQYQFDLMGRPLKVIGSDGQVRQFTYDDPNVLFGLNRRRTAQVTNGQGAVESGYQYAYNAHGNRKNVSMSVAGISKTYTTNEEFDTLARLVQLQNPDNSVVSRSYSGSRLVQVTLQSGAKASFSDFSASGTPRRVTYGNGVMAV